MSLTKKLALSPSSTVHGGQYDTKYVTFELLLHAAFVADESWSDTLEPARNPDLLANFSDCCVMTSLCALLTVLSKLGRVLYPAAG